MITLFPNSPIFIGRRQRGKKTDETRFGGQEGGKSLRLVLPSHHERRNDRVLRRLGLLHIPTVVILDLGSDKGVVRYRNKKTRRPELLFPDFRV